MNTTLTTISARSHTFTVREGFKESIKALQVEAASDPWRSIQDLLVRLLNVQPDIRTDEAALMVHVGFPASKYAEPAKRARRISVDVKKFNKGKLAGQAEAPAVPAVHLDAPKGGAKRVADDALDILADILS